MRVLLTLAVHAFRDTMRSKILYAVFAYAVLVLVVAVLGGQLALGAEARFVTDVGLAGMTILGLLLVITRGAETLFREVERKTVLAILARPIHRWQFVVGNFIGMAWVLLLLVACFLAVLLVIITPMGGHLTWALVAAAWGVFLELLMVWGVALLVSNLSSHILATIITLFFFVAGHMASELYKWVNPTSETLGEHLSPSMQRVAEAYQTGVGNWFLRLAYFVLPNMEHVNFKRYAASNLQVPLDAVVLGTLYAFVYASIGVLLAVIVFSRRDMK
jgi:ABC-type transport system involved in multi-copper enzyme maturation permease subunit